MKDVIRWNGIMVSFNTHSIYGYQLVFTSIKGVSNYLGLDSSSQFFRLCDDHLKFLKRLEAGR
jgi:hypothetical protein